MRLWEWACVSVVLGLELLPCFLGTRVCLFGWLCLHVSGWMGCLFVGVPLGLGLCAWVSVCFSVLFPQQPGSQLSHICALLLDLDSFLPKLSPSHSLGAPLPLLTDTLDSVLLEVSGSGQREDTRCSVSPDLEALSRPRGTSEDRSSSVGLLWRLGWLTEL